MAKRRRSAPAIGSLSPNLLLIGAGVLAVFWLLNRRNSAGQSLSYELGRDVVGGAANVVGDVFGGGIVGIGKTVGIPETNVSECEAAKARGSAWDASFACPAGEFLSYWWNR